MRDSFVFYRSFAEALAETDAETKASVLDAICAFALDGVELDLSGVAKALFVLMRPQIEANNRRYQNGTKGGRPKTKDEAGENQEGTKAKPKQNLSKTKSEPNVNDNKNVNVNVNDKCIKHKRGTYKHVLLTDEDLERLKADYGERLTQAAIQVVDDYCETSGKRYKNYNLVIRGWGMDRAKQNVKTNEKKSRYNIEELEGAVLWQ